MQCVHPSIMNSKQQPHLFHREDIAVFTYSKKLAIPKEYPDLLPNIDKLHYACPLLLLICNNYTYSGQDSIDMV